tara:strand:- start:862 stop:1419 length:558 start_codon:yes stop_codon:yes gene_type:complete
MNMHVDFLIERNSAARLDEPAPNRSELSVMLRSAFRVPDHAGLKPVRFISIENNRLEALGDIFEQALIKRNPAASESQRERARKSPLRAPMIIVAVAKMTEHAKVPVMEQRLSAGCSAYAILLSAEAFNYAGIWRTGDASRDPHVAKSLGVEKNEEIIGFLYLGTRIGEPKVPDKNIPEDCLSHW